MSDIYFFKILSCNSCKLPVISILLIFFIKTILNSKNFIKSLGILKKSDIIFEDLIYISSLIINSIVDNNSSLKKSFNLSSLSNVLNISSNETGLSFISIKLSVSICN